MKNGIVKISLLLFYTTSSTSPACAIQYVSITGIVTSNINKKSVYGYDSSYNPIGTQIETHGPVGQRYKIVVGFDDSLASFKKVDTPYYSGSTYSLLTVDPGNSKPPEGVFPYYSDLPNFRSELSKAFDLRNISYQYNSYNYNGQISLSSVVNQGALERKLVIGTGALAINSGINRTRLQDFIDPFSTWIPEGLANNMRFLSSTSNTNFNNVTGHAQQQYGLGLTISDPNAKFLPIVEPSTFSNLGSLNIPNGFSLSYSSVEKFDISFNKDLPSFITDAANVTQVTTTVDRITVLSGLPTDAVPATDLELAKISRGVYDKVPSVGLFQRIGEVGDGSGNSVYAEIFRSEGENGGRSEIIVAIRGSGPQFDWTKRNTSFLSQEATLTFVEGLKEIAAKLKGIYAENNDANYTFTGHSLGGAYAQVLGQAFKGRAVGFNAPGALGLVDEATFDELRSISGGINFQHEDQRNIRHYGDIVSLLGVPIGKQILIANTSEVATLGPSKQEIDARVSGFEPAPCIYTCHQMELMEHLIESGAENFPEFVSPYRELPKIVAGLLTGAVGLKNFNEVIFGDALSAIFDPNLAGNTIEISLNDSSTWISQFYLPSDGNFFDVYGRFGNSWSYIGNFEGAKYFDVPRSMSYRILNAEKLAIENGSFFIGIKFGDTGIFQGSIASINWTPDAVPEMDTWLLLLTGFVVVGVTFRRRNHLNAGNLS